MDQAIIDLIWLMGDANRNREVGGTCLETYLEVGPTLDLFLKKYKVIDNHLSVMDFGKRKITKLSITLKITWSRRELKNNFSLMTSS